MPFQELSSVQYYTHEEQLTELTAALKEQYARHCFIKIHTDPTQAMLVPRIDSPYTSPKSLSWYQGKRLVDYKSLPAPEVDALIAARETALLQAVKPEAIPYLGKSSPTDLATASPWTRQPPADRPSALSKPPESQETGGKGGRGPTTDWETHTKIASIVSGFGNDWTKHEQLMEICEQLDKAHVPVPKTWPILSDHPARTWLGALLYHRDLVKKAIRYSREKAQGQCASRD